MSNKRQTYWIKTNNAVISEKEAVVGLYRFVHSYPLMKDPKNYNHAQIHYNHVSAPLAQTTGNVFEIGGVEIAYEIITVLNDEPVIRWTIPHSLERVAEIKED